MRSLVLCLFLPFLLVGCCYFFPCAAIQMDDLNEAFLRGEISLEQYNAAYEKLAPAAMRDYRTFS